MHHKTRFMQDKFSWHALFEILSLWMDTVFICKNTHALCSAIAVKTIYNGWRKVQSIFLSLTTLTMALTTLMINLLSKLSYCIQNS